MSRTVTGLIMYDSSTEDFEPDYLQRCDTLETLEERTKRNIIASVALKHACCGTSSKEWDASLAYEFFVSKP